MEPSEHVVAALPVEQLAAPERVDEDLGVDPVAEEEVAGQADAGDGHADPATHLHGEHGQRDGDAQVAVEHVVEVAVGGVVVVVLVADEALVDEEVVQEAVERGRAAACGEVVQPRQEVVGVDAGVGVGREHGPGQVEGHLGVGAADQVGEVVAGLPASVTRHRTGGHRDAWLGRVRHVPRFA